MPGWFSPHASVSVALVMYGKVGTLRLPSSFEDGSRPEESKAVIRLAHTTVRRHVIDVNPNSSMRFFVHSWNPNLGSFIDRLYTPLWSQHDTLESNEPVFSAGTSLSRALKAVRLAERTRGQPFDLIACWRHDLHFSGSLRWKELPRAQLWFPSMCCAPDLKGLKDRSWVTPSNQRRKAACHSEGGTYSDYCRASWFMSMVGSGRDLATEAHYNYWVNDWLFVAPSHTAHTFRAIASHLELYSEALRLVGIRLKWMHFYWSAHVHHVLGAASGVRALPLRASVDLWVPHAGSRGRECRTNTTVHDLLPRRPEPVWGGFAHALCPPHEHGRVTCPWTSPRCMADTPNGNANGD